MGGLARADGAGDQERFHRKSAKKKAGRQPKPRHRPFLLQGTTMPPGIPGAYPPFPASPRREGDGERNPHRHWLVPILGRSELDLPTDTERGLVQGLMP